eukprot:gene8267-9149_t
MPRNGEKVVNSGHSQRAEGMLITGRLCPARFTLEAQRNAEADVVAHASQKLCSRKTERGEVVVNAYLHECSQNLKNPLGKMFSGSTSHHITK